MTVEDDLRAETLKWLSRADTLFAQISGEERFAENISAYIKDSRHFLQKGDLVRAFEAVVWAWAWMEIGLEMETLSREDCKDRKDCREGWTGEA